MADANTCYGRFGHFPEREQILHWRLVTQLLGLTNTLEVPDSGEEMVYSDEKPRSIMHLRRFLDHLANILVRENEVVAVVPETSKPATIHNVMVLESEYESIDLNTTENYRRSAESRKRAKVKKYNPLSDSQLPYNTISIDDEEQVVPQSVGALLMEKSYRTDTNLEQAKFAIDISYAEHSQIVVALVKACHVKHEDRSIHEESVDDLTAYVMAISQGKMQRRWRSGTKRDGRNIIHALLGPGDVYKEAEGSRVLCPDDLIDATAGMPLFQWIYLEELVKIVYNQSRHPDLNPNSADSFPKRQYGDADARLKFQTFVSEAFKWTLAAFDRLHDAKRAAYLFHYNCQKDRNVDQREYQEQKKPFEMAIDAAAWNLHYAMTVMLALSDEDRAGQLFKRHLHWISCVWEFSSSRQGFPSAYSFLMDSGQLAEDRLKSTNRDQRAETGSISSVTTLGSKINTMETSSRTELAPHEFGEQGWEVGHSTWATSAKVLCVKLATHEAAIFQIVEKAQRILGTSFWVEVSKMKIVEVVPSAHDRERQRLDDFLENFQWELERGLYYKDEQNLSEEQRLQITAFFANKNLKSDPGLPTSLPMDFMAPIHCETVIISLFLLALEHDKKRGGLVDHSPKGDNPDLTVLPAESIFTRFRHFGTTLSVSKKCCPACKFLVDLANGALKVARKPPVLWPGYHSHWTAVDLPAWLPQPYADRLIVHAEQVLEKRLWNLVHGGTTYHVGSDKGTPVNPSDYDVKVTGSWLPRARSQKAVHGEASLPVRTSKPCEPIPLGSESGRTQQGVALEQTAGPPRALGPIPPLRPAQPTPSSQPVFPSWRDFSGPSGLANHASHPNYPDTASPPQQGVKRAASRSDRPRGGSPPKSPRKE